jgi:MoxR-like ATPase
VTELNLTPAEATERCAAVLDEIERAVVGNRRSLELVMMGILSGGHVLLEDLPGLGKTLIARSFATALGLEFARIQFTPDLLPSDVVGAPLYDQRTAQMVFRPGPVFTQLLLADEINRTPPKTQAALLEAMGEGQVSMDGVTHRLPQPFVVLATDNPIEYEGTYELPEAQLDRFLMRLRLGYLTSDDEATMLQPADRQTAGSGGAPAGDERSRGHRHAGVARAGRDRARSGGLRGRHRAGHARERPDPGRRQSARRPRPDPAGQGPGAVARP